MKTKSFLTIAGLLFSILMLTHCKRYDNGLEANPDIRLAIVSATATAKKQVLMMADTLHSLTFEVMHDEAAGNAGSDISIAFKSDNALVQQYNMYNETQYLELPAGSYTLPASATIAKGKQKSDPLKIKIKTTGALEAFKQYLLPVSIEKVTDGFLVNQNLKTIYFLIETLREGVTFKVMSYGKGGGVYDMALAAAIIKAHNPDLLLVREMDSVTNRNGKVNQPEVLSGLIQMPHYAYLTSITNFDGGGQYGATLYSKYPITKSTEVVLPTGDANTEKGPFGVITVQIGGQSIGFAGTHLNANAARRAAQLPALVEAVNAFTEPLILAGNFNEAPPASSVYTALAGALLNFPCTSCPANTPVAAPTSYSDFIMYRPTTKLKVMSHNVGTSSTSAHLPVITEFMLFK